MTSGRSPGTVAGSDGFPTPYRQGHSGTLEIPIGGRTAGTQYSRLAVNGAVAFDGTLRVNLINGFVPALGNTFTVVT